MKRGPIRLDFSRESVVVTCEECPAWYGFGFTREEGWKAARRHELRAHPGAKQATMALKALLNREELAAFDTLESGDFQES